MPAQSPTLSPTLSAITAGLRGSSSGIPASTLPTRSAPTSAALVKMPPPRRAKIEISEAPKASATSASITIAVVGRVGRGCDEEVEEDRDGEQRQAGDEHAGDRAGAERDGQALLQAGARRLGGADVGADRDVHADEAGRPDSSAPSTKPAACRPPRKNKTRPRRPRRRRRSCCTGGTDRPWRLPGSQRRPRSSARCRRSRREHLAAGENAVEHGDNATGNGNEHDGRENVPFP